MKFVLALEKLKTSLQACFLLQKFYAFTNIFNEERAKLQTIIIQYCSIHLSVIDEQKLQKTEKDEKQFFQNERSKMHTYI